MIDGFTDWVMTLVGQIPLLIVYGIGLVVALAHRADKPEASRRVILAFVLLLADAFLLSALSVWMLHSVLTEESDISSVRLFLTLVELARSVVHAVAIWLLVRTIFPAANSPMPGWLRRSIGALVGIVAGGVIAAALGDPIGTALGVSDFEGEKGYFVFLVLIPLFALIGGITGAIVSGR